MPRERNRRVLGVWFGLVVLSAVLVGTAPAAVAQAASTPESDSSGQLGDGGNNTSQPVPVAVAGGVTDWTAVSVGSTHTCARRVIGRLYCWGADFSGQLGNGGPNVEKHIPTLVAGGATDWTSVSAGDSHTCGRRTTGRLYCWGNDSSGELGDGGADADSQAPVQVAGGATDWTLVDAGAGHSCARITSGRLLCWGLDAAGQLGDGGTNTDQGRPAPVFAP